MKTKRKLIVFDHARVDTSHCLTDGLFRPLSRVPKAEPLDVTHIYKGYTLRWLNYCRLNIVDQSVFLALHRLAAESERIKRIGNESESQVLKDIRAALKLEKDAINNDCLALDTSVYEIAKIMGITDGGENLRMIKRSLFRLSCVNFAIYKGDNIEDAFFKTNLISHLAGIDGKIHIGINPMLGKALAGGQSTFVSMEEQRQLHGDIAKRLHMWLSSWMQDGEERKIDIDKLIPHVWGEESESATKRKRRHSLRKAFMEINSLVSWKISEIDCYLVVKKSDCKNTVVSGTLYRSKRNVLP